MQSREINGIAYISKAEAKTLLGEPSEYTFARLLESGKLGTPFSYEDRKHARKYFELERVQAYIDGRVSDPLPESEQGIKATARELAG